MKHGMKLINGKRLLTLELTEEELNIVHEGLMHVPFGRAAPVVNSISEQLAPPKPVSTDQPDIAAELGYRK